LPDGDGEITYKNGQKYIGKFEKGNITGAGIMY
jgi:hypothetical protein